MSEKYSDICPLRYRNFKPNHCCKRSQPKTTVLAITILLIDTIRNDRRHLKKKKEERETSPISIFPPLASSFLFGETEKRRNETEENFLRFAETPRRAANQNALKFHDGIFEKFNREPRFDGSWNPAFLNPACQATSIQNSLSLSPPRRLSLPNREKKKMRDSIRGETPKQSRQSARACKGEGFKVSLRSLKV